MESLKTLLAATKDINDELVVVRSSLELIEYAVRSEHVEALRSFINNRLFDARVALDRIAKSGERV